jgi:hypothetical protein
MAFCLTARATRTTFLTRGPRSIHIFRGPTTLPVNTIPRQPNQPLSKLVGIIKRIPKSLIIFELFATAGTLAFGNEDLVAMGRKGMSMIKKNVEQVLERGMGGKIVVKREEGKWEVIVERKK